ncbi:MAG: riboflavin biosynthesis protein RibF, partial [Betaproteobacteria bacterium]|nr:riboflavin biosynthesis protein RibF [Betaproteobacteria bacterium]
MVVTHGTPVPRGPQALTVGNFDGVHRGHQAMLARLVAKARELGVPSCVLTFEPHPREFFSADRAPARLARLREKIERFVEAGVDRVHVARFDAGFASLAPERFIGDMLLRGLGARWLLVGRDFRFGVRRTGDFATIEKAAARDGFELEAMPDVLDRSERISSSAVRQALESADFALAGRLLGRPYEVSGRVAHGRKLGRELGFPTANIVLRRRAPLAGVY